MWFHETVYHLDVIGEEAPPDLGDSLRYAEIGDEAAEDFGDSLSNILFYTHPKYLQ